MSLDLENNFKWLAVQYQSTNIQKLLKEIGILQQELLGDVIVQYAEKYSIDTADGVWLDYVGYRLGVFNRPTLYSVEDDYFGFDGAGTGFDQASFVPGADSFGLSDYDYRRFLKVRAQYLITDMTSASIRNALLLFFENVVVIDNGDMSMTVDIYTLQAIGIVQSVIDAGIIQKPAGVKLTTNIVYGEYFGFADSGQSGFDNSSFVATE